VADVAMLVAPQASGAPLTLDGILADARVRDMVEESYDLVA